jgi:glycerol uptake facilitator-like aquaporin
MCWSGAVYATANVSGGHVNPAVTLANCMTGHMSWGRGGLYAVAQLLGAIFGTLIEVSLLSYFLSSVTCERGRSVALQHWFCSVLRSVLISRGWFPEYP